MNTALVFSGRSVSIRVITLGIRLKRNDDGRRLSRHRYAGFQSFKGVKN